MLSLVAAKEVRPEVESLDKDPGILSLIAAFARFTARQTASTVRSVQTFNQRVKAAEAFSSSTAWPYYDRSR
ncbi:hypothetical protein [Methylobacterium brachythecii]|uniref:Uncharacterized protein n=1 Tax=Methylobacterium brachythecii TaxID=1176177 RepID=A0A7W6AR74_9HYPH|nr:hypothetical protein [Methylobacterium brachythecii]MBB3904397.1 hypothetical protein [Methylobacterium brachythecii]GLS43674.1 hypothetical protein GCM10007884_16590 [Methylobacterium brachythecii]